MIRPMHSLSERVDVSVYEYPQAALVGALQPIPIKKPLQKIETPAERRAVFGITKNALVEEPNHVNNGTGIEIKAGNTLAVAPDDRKLQPGEEGAIPIPTEEFMVTQMPRMVAEVRIPYPKEAREKGIEGPVVMDLLIDQQGDVREAKLIEGPDDILNDAALEAVRRSKFNPAKVVDRTVAVRIRYVYRFVLEP